MLNKELHLLCLVVTQKLTVLVLTYNIQCVFVSLLISAIVTATFWSNHLDLFQTFSLLLSHFFPEYVKIVPRKRSFWTPFNHEQLEWQVMDYLRLKLLSVNPEILKESTLKSKRKNKLRKQNTHLMTQYTARLHWLLSDYVIFFFFYISLKVLSSHQGSNTQSTHRCLSVYNLCRSTHN